MGYQYIWWAHNSCLHLLRFDGNAIPGLPVKGFQGEGLRSNCCLKPTKKLQLSYGDEYFWPIYGGSRRLGRIAWTVMKLYCIQSYVIKAPINTDSPTPSMMSHSMQIDNYKYVSFCEIHNSFLPIITLKLSEIRMENSSLLLPDLKSGCCDSTVKFVCRLRSCSGWKSRRFRLRRIKNSPNSKIWSLWFACSLSLWLWKSWHCS